MSQIVLSTGGTGGHVFPALALAETLVQRGHNVTLICDTRGQRYVYDAPVSLVVLSVHNPARASWGAKAKGYMSLITSFVRCYRLLHTLKPAVVVGFGGYFCFPPLLAARLLGLPFVLHEQNAVLSKINALFARSAQALCLSWSPTQKIPPHTTCHETGHPIRPIIHSYAGTPYPSRSSEEDFHLLVLGGSQGASFLSTLIFEAACSLPLSFRKKLVLHQQTRPLSLEELDALTERYSSFCIRAVVEPFFEEVGPLFQQAHLVLARSGASTLSDTTTLGRPALLIPLPHATHDHQTLNARLLCERGAAWMLPQKECTPALIQEKLIYFMTHPRILEEAAKSLEGHAPTDASHRLSDVVESVCS